MNAAPADPSVQKWTWTYWLAVVAVVFILHLALILIFGSYKPPVPIRVASNTPSLMLAIGSSGGWPVPNNATLYALPDKNGFAGVMWTALPPLPFHKQDWTEDPRWLAATDSLPARELGAGFNHFVQTNHFASVHMEYHLAPPPAAPMTSVNPPFAQSSSLEIEGDISKRPLLNPVKLPSWPFTDVIPPSAVQVLVDAAGNVVSATLLPPDNYSDTLVTRDPAADQRAVEIARTFRFTPLSPDAGSVEANPVGHLTVGRLIFNWQTVSPATVGGSQ